LGRNDLAEVKARHQARHNSAIRRIRRPIVMKASIGDGMILRGRFAVSARRLEIWFQSALNFSVAVLVSSTMDQLGSVIRAPTIVIARVEFGSACLTGPVHTRRTGPVRGRIADRRGNNASPMK
jgi:hypothetical protein